MRSIGVSISVERALLACLVVKVYPDAVVDKGLRGAAETPDSLDHNGAPGIQFVPLAGRTSGQAAAIARPSSVLPEPERPSMRQRQRGEGKPRTSDPPDEGARERATGSGEQGSAESTDNEIPTSRKHSNNGSGNADSYTYEKSEPLGTAPVRFACPRAGRCAAETPCFHRNRELASASDR